jgi:uncharacterized membrane protein YeaQ/YmgE (transglycosylase-associated protein family)
LRFCKQNHQEKTKMNWMPIIIQLISGGVGGNIAGALLKKFNLGPIGNTIAGILGGVGGGQLLGMLTGAAAAAPAAAAGGFDISSMLSNIGGGGVGGAVIMVIVGLIKAQMSKSSTANA